LETTNDTNHAKKEGLKAFKGLVADARVPLPYSIMPLDTAIIQRIRSAVREDRLLDTAVRLVEVPSPTCDAGAVADRLAEILRDDGFAVERPEANWPQAPAVVARLHSARPGRTLQFDGHLDTVHLPFVPPRVADGILTGSGASDMKGGVAAALEALRALRDSGMLTAGSVLFTAHDHHEGPWGDCRQLYAMIEQGITGDAVLLPEYLCDRLPIVGRGLSILEIRVSRPGETVHEVFRPPGTPDVVGAGAELIRRFQRLNAELAARPHAVAGPGTIFFGKFQAGEIFNQSPTECRIEGTRRWLPGESTAQVADQYQSILRSVASETGTAIESAFDVRRDAFEIDAGSPLVAAFQSAHQTITGRPLPIGAKPFVDDGNAFVARARIPAITHGPNATGAHTLHERVPVAELVRVACVYALTAAAFCSG
jgi:acetylornithine deacetylase/succinyl-diaminopimelate desuccinylase-like protein